MRCREALMEQLRRLGIPIERWGRGEARTLEDFYREVGSGEASLQESSDGRLFRIVNGATVNVFYRNAAGETLKLTEERQVYKDGRVRKRAADLRMSVGEKMRKGETPEAAARRALAEDLGIHDGELALLPSKEPFEQTSPSKAFPGLFTRYTSHRFDLFLPGEYYRAEGYEKRQPDKTTSFVWKKIEG